AGLREGELPPVDVAGVVACPVLHAQLPGAVRRLGGGVDRVGLLDVVRGPAGVIAQVVDAAVRGAQVDDQVPAPGAHDVDRDPGVRRGAARPSGDGDRGRHGGAVVRDRPVGGVLEGRAVAATAVTGARDHVHAGPLVLHRLVLGAVRAVQLAGRRQGAGAGRSGAG